MNRIRRDADELLKLFIDEIKNFDFFIENWRNTVVFLRDETDYVIKASKLNEHFFKFIQEPCCVIFYMNNLCFKKYVVDYLIKYVLSSINSTVKKNFLVTLEQLVSIDYHEENNCFRNESLNMFYGEKLVHLTKEINDLGIELSFNNEFNAKLSFWGRKNFEHGLSLIRYVLKTVGQQTLIDLGYKHQHFEFLINTFPNFCILPKIIEAFTSTAFKFNLENNRMITYSYLVTLETFYLIILKTFLSIKFHTKSYDLKITILKNLIDFYDKHVKNGQLMSNYSAWNKTITKIVEFSVQKIYEESEKKYIRLRFTYICYFLHKFKVLFNFVNELKKQKYAEKLVFSIKRILISIDQSGMFRELDQDEIETKQICFNVIYEIIKDLKEKIISSLIKNFSHIWIKELGSYNESAINCLEFIFSLKSTCLNLFSKNLIDLIKKQISSQNENKNLTKYLIAVESVFQFESNSQKDRLVSIELIQVVKEMQKVLSKQIPEGNCEDLNKFFLFSRKILDTLKIKNIFRVKTSDSDWYNFVFEIFTIFEKIKYNHLKFEIFPNVYQNCFELIKIIFDILNASQTINFFIYGIFEMLNFIECNLPVDCSCEFKNELLFTLQRVKPSVSKLFN